MIDETPVAFTLSYKDGATAEVKAASDQSDAAVEFEVDKTVMGADTPLPGAKFQAWNTDDEISIGSAAGNLAVRAEAGSEVSIRKAVSTANVKSEADDGTSLVLKSADGLETQLGPDAIDMKPGTYTLTATQDGKTLEGAEVEIEAGKAYTAKVAGGLLGNHAVLSDDGYAMPAIKLAWSEANSAYVAPRPWARHIRPDRRRQSRRTGRDRRGRADLHLGQRRPRPPGARPAQGGQERHRGRDRRRRLD